MKLGIVWGPSHVAGFGHANNAKTWLMFCTQHLMSARQVFVNNVVMDGSSLIAIMFVRALP